MIRIIEYKSAHADDIFNQNSNDTSVENFEDYIGFGDGLYAPGLAFTAIHNGHIVCSAGIKPLWPGVGEAWIIATWRINKKALSVVKAIHRDFERLIETNGFNRVQAAVRSDWPQAVNFCEYLGFKQEGLMRQYGVDGRDYFRYARLK